MFGGEYILIVRISAERGERIAVVTAQTIPRTQPKKIVGCLHYA
jgi:hypothetical protein